MRKDLIVKMKVLRQYFARCRSYSFIDWVQTIGGFLIMMYIPLLIGLIWFDTQTMSKVIATNSVLILGLWIIDRSYNGS